MVIFPVCRAKRRGVPPMNLPEDRSFQLVPFVKRSDGL